MPQSVSRLLHSIKSLATEETVPLQISNKLEIQIGCLLTVLGSFFFGLSLKAFDCREKKPRRSGLSKTGFYFAHSLKCKSICGTVRLCPLQ